MIEAFMIGLLIVGAIVTVIALGLLGTMWRSWWLYPAWGWFIMPLGMPSITFWHFTALLFFVETVSQRLDTKKDERPENRLTWVILFCWPIVAWALLRWMR